MYDSVYEKRKFLTISPYESDNHITNFYYFRLGAAATNDGTTFIHRKQGITVPRNGFVAIWSLESFHLTERVLGLFGNLSAFVHQGLQLIHSPSIDPGFNGALRLGIKNNTSKKITLPVGTRIGKILFFDVSDSHIEAQQFIKSEIKKKELEDREKTGDELYRFMME